MKESRRLWKAAQATCLVAGLVSTWDTPAKAQTYNFTGAITPTSNLSDVYFLFAVGVCSPGGGVFAQEISSFIPANTTYNFNLTYNSLPANLADSFTVVGLYDTVNGGVSIGYDSAHGANLLGLSPAPDWSGPFLPATSASSGSLYYQYIGASESDVATAIGNGFSAGSPFIPIGTPFPGISTDPANPSTFTMINYSTASNGGSGFVVEAVPEPTVTSLLAGAALLPFWYLRRRRAG